MLQAPDILKDVNLQLKANIYFDGGVISHSFTEMDGRKKTVGIIRVGRYHFTTDAPEKMFIIAGSCRVQLAGESGFHPVKAGESFEVPGKSAFDITVDSGITEYLCSFG